MKCKLKLYFYALMPLLCFALVLPNFTILSKASTTESGVSFTSPYTTIYDNNGLNAKMINAYNSMSDYEKTELMPAISPIVFRKLGILSNDSYVTMNQYYNGILNAFKAEYTSATEAWNDENTTNEERQTFMYDTGRTAQGNPVYAYYDNFSDFLARNIVADDGMLVFDGAQTIYNIYDGVIEEEREENGVINVTLKSYQNINSSNFGNLSQYTDFIRLCKEHRNVGYVVIAHSTPSENNIMVGFPQQKPNLYNNGTTVGYTLNFCNNDGVGYYNFDWYTTTRWNNNQDTHFSFDNSYTYGRNFAVGGSTLPYLGVNSSQNNFRVDGFALYTLNESETTYTLFTSLNGWLNHEGHYEPSYQLGSNYGIVPSAVVSSNDITTYYNNTYVDNSQGSHNNVWYPPNYNPNDNSYNEDTHTLKFDGIGNFLSSLGNLIGSLINGIADGIANIINSLITVVNNLKGNLLQGVIFEFLSALMGWLPVEIVTLLTALFAITVIFALIKLLKGFF